MFALAFSTTDDANVLVLAAAAVVAAAGIFLVVLAISTMFAPRRAERFLGAFAASARNHVIEQVLRLIAGCSLVTYAPHMRISTFFEVLGWLLIATSLGLLMIPWRWHHRFAQWAIPMAIRHLKLYGLGAGILGVLILVSMF